MTESNFQQRCTAWAFECFGGEVVMNLTERCDRALEEFIELLQSLGYDRSRIETLVDYVYNRPVGEPPQELGGVMVTLAVLSSVAGLHMEFDGGVELMRIEQPEMMAKIREKQASKRGIHTPLPVPPEPCPYIEVVGIDEYGPRLGWSHDWNSFAIGTKFYRKL